MTEQREEELMALEAIFDPSDLEIRQDRCGGKIFIAVDLEEDRQIQVLDEHMQITVHHLPKLALVFTYVDGYPEEKMPEVQIECEWLENVLLREWEAALSDLWQKRQSFGEVVLFEWCQIMKEKSVAMLYAKEFSLSVSTAVLQRIRTYDRIIRGLRMRSCEICFDELLGATFESGSAECNHEFCPNCLKSHCEAKIENGQMTRVLCPSPSCGHPVDGATMKRLVEPKHFERFDQAMLQQVVRSV